MSKCKERVIITIGRTFGSGAREIGRKVAEELEIPFYDKELLEVAAKESGGSHTEYLAPYDEKRVSGFIYSASFNSYVGERLPLDMVIQDILIKTARAVADQGSCVIVGRRADKILRRQYDILSVFITASMENRIARVSKRDSLSVIESEKKIQKADKTRQAFYNSYGNGDWGEADNYNLCLDSGNLGIDNSVAMILKYLNLKGKLA